MKIILLLISLNCLADDSALTDKIQASIDEGQDKTEIENTLNDQGIYDIKDLDNELEYTPENEE